MTVRRTAAWLVLILASAIAGRCQDYPKVELFGGYSYTRTDLPPGHANASGWATSLSGNLNRHFGLTADFAGHHGGASESFNTLQYMLGPRFTLRQKRTTWFVHGLVGVYRFDSGRALTRTGMDFGGGLDIKIGRHTAFRILQIDYVPARTYGTWRDNLQVRTGVVFMFGKR
jgi:hypothetical protein